MKRFGEQVLTLAAYHIVETVTTLSTDFAIALTEDFVNENILILGICQILCCSEFELAIYFFEASEAHTAANYMQIIQRTLEISCLGLCLGTDEIHLCQTDVGNTDEVVIITTSTIVVEQPLELAIT